MNIINGNLQSLSDLRQTSHALYIGILVIQGKLTEIRGKLKMSFTF